MGGRHRGRDRRPFARHLEDAPLGNTFINAGWGGTGGFKSIPPGSGWAMAELVAKGEPGPPLAAEFGLDRFREGRFIDESVAAGVAH